MFELPTDYREQMVVFMDILAFSDLIDRIEKDIDLHKKIHWALTHIESYKKASKADYAVQSNLQISVFSDSIVFSGETDKYFEILWSAAWLHTQLLGFGILTRGGITIGKLFHSDKIIYGDGIIKAHDLESKAAVYPRIVLDPLLLSIIPEELRTLFLSKDTDGLYYIDPFAFNGSLGNVDSQLEDGYDPHEIYFEELAAQIKIELEKAKRIDQKAKWNWLHSKFDVAYKEYLETRKTRESLFFEKNQK